jgi:hypothetical protein
MDDDPCQPGLETFCRKSIKMSANWDDEAMSSGSVGPEAGSRVDGCPHHEIALASVGVAPIIIDS